MDLSRLLSVARGDAPADLLLANARVVNVFSGEVEPTGIAVAGGRIAGIGAGYGAKETLDLGGRYVCPGFIDAHVHVESALVTPREFARAVVPRGVTSVVTNPHEIANVCGIPGILFMMEDAAGMPMTQYVTVPSCVPASRLATSGGRLDADDLEQLLDEPLVLGLGEMMDFPGVVSGDERALSEILSFSGGTIDGHAPGLSGKSLNAYVAAGITSDHECVTAEEAREKLRLGMTIFAREATAARNLRALLPLVTPRTERRFCLCTDDRQPGDLLDEGSIDHLIRLAIAQGIDPVTAIRMGTLNPAEHYGLNDLGAVAPGRRADLVVFSNLQRPSAEMVFRSGSLVGREGELLTGRGRTDNPFFGEVRNRVKVEVADLEFSIPAAGTRIRAIGIIPDQIATEHLVLEAKIEGGKAVADPDRDLLKIAVIERHLGSGRIGLGFVRGMGLRSGAIAGTVAHDHHNLVVIGADDRSMRTAARAAAISGGGLAAARGDGVLCHLQLPIAGLMSDQPIETVRLGHDRLVEAARSLGSPLRDPFMTMSFLALEVIPALKLTDLGVVDVERFEIVPLFAPSGG